MEKDDNLLKTNQKITKTEMGSWFLHLAVQWSQIILFPLVSYSSATSTLNID